MAINFNALPTSANTITPVGLYRAKIEKAEMRQAYIPTEPMELSMTCTLYDYKGKDCGKFFDTLKDNGKDAQLFKIGQFVKAIGLELTGSVELKDMCKLIQGKEFIVDISHYTNPTTNNTKAQSNIFGNKGCFAPVSEFAALLGEDGAIEATAEDMPWTEPAKEDNASINPTGVELPAETTDDAEVSPY